MTTVVERNMPNFVRIESAIITENPVKALLRLVNMIRMNQRAQNIPLKFTRSTKYNNSPFIFALSTLKK